jgi:hypothetical protein
MVGEQVWKCTWWLYLEVYLEVVDQMAIDWKGCTMDANILIIS